MADTIFFSLEEISKNDSKNGNKTWIIYKDSVYDVTDYLDEHPGGGDLITEYAGRDATKAFDNAGHSNDAKKQMKQFRIGEVKLEDRKQTKTETVTNKDKENRRSCCSYLTCGLCD